MQPSNMQSSNMQEPDLFRIFEDNKPTIKYFKNQLAYLRDYQTNFDLSKEAHRHHRILDNARTYATPFVGYLERCEDCPSDEPFKAVRDGGFSEAALYRDNEIKLLENIVEGLNWIQVSLLEDMKLTHLVQAIEDLQPAILKETRTRLEHRLEHIEHLDKTLKSKERAWSQMTKNEIEERVVDIQCDRNIKLNRFEEATRQSVIDNFAERIELEWASHLCKLSSLRRHVAETNYNVASCENKIRLVRIRIRGTPINKADDILEQQMLDNQKRVETLQALQAASPYDNSCGDDLHSLIKTPPPTYGIGIARLPQERKVAVSDERLPLAVGSALSTAGGDIDVAEDWSRDNQSSSRETNNRQHVDYAQAATAAPESSHDAQVNLQATREYDHNKASTPSPPLSSENRPSTTAFDGLDKYARGVFASNPSVAPPK